MSEPLGHIVQAKIYVTDGDQLGLNIRQWVVAANAGVGSNLAALADYLSSGLSGWYKQIMRDPARFEGVQVQDLSLGPAAPKFVSRLGAGIATNSTNQAGKQLCQLIKLLTGLTGRKNHGRVYLPFICADALTIDGKVSFTGLTRSAGVASYLGVPIAVGSGPDTTTFNPVIYHRVTATATQITDYILEDKLATQRRRSDFGRQNPPPF